MLDRSHPTCGGSDVRRFTRNPGNSRGGPCLPGMRALVVIGLVLVSGMGGAPRQDAVRVNTAPLIDQCRFASEPPDGWSMDAGWEFSATGARALSPAVATWDRALPASCLLDMVFDLPSRGSDEAADNDEPKPLGVAALTIGGPDDGDPVSVEARYLPQKYEATIAGPGADGQVTNVNVGGDARPSVLRAWEEADEHPGWAGQTGA